MRILFITSRADIGGGPKHLLELAQKTKELQPKSFIAIAAPDQEPYANQFQQTSDYYIKIPARRFTLLSFYKLLIFCREKNIQIVHSHGRGAGYYSRLLALFSFKTLHTFHGVQNNSTLIDLIKNVIEAFFSRVNSKLIFVSVSEKDKAKFLNYYLNKNFHIIENGINLSNIENRINLQNHPTQINFCILSRFDSHKNVTRSIELFNEFLKTSPLSKLNIGGTGPEKEKLKALVRELNIENSVKFYGLITDTDSFLKSQDFLISTSKGEGLPYTVLEAMKNGVIPILSNVSGHKDILSSRYLFDPNDEKEFIRKIINLKQNKHHNFSDILMRRFDIHRQLRKVIRLYDELCK